MAKRIQRKRVKGWRMPDNAVYVGRPTKWGNPFAVGEQYPVTEHELGPPIEMRVCEDASDAVDCFENYIQQDLSFDLREDARHELRGKDLACWCPLDQPCHADVLLRIANEGEGTPPAAPERGCKADRPPRVARDRATDVGRRQE